MSSNYSRDSGAVRPRIWLLKNEIAKNRPTTRERSNTNTRKMPRNNSLAVLGAGIKVKVSFFPKLGQITLAFATLLFIGSIDLLVFTVLTVGPGLISKNFQETTCKVSHAIYNGNTYCYVTSLDSNHGKIMTFPCLQLYVTTSERNTTSYGNLNLVDNPLNPDNQIQSAYSVSSINLQPNVSYTNISAPSDDSILMYENELYLAGQDYKHRPCSYLPYFCNGNLSQVASIVINHANSLIGLEQGFKCYIDENNISMGDAKPVVLHKRTIFKSQIIHAITWPLAGTLSSFIICAQFWKHNKDHVSRLFVYNSWSLS